MTLNASISALFRDALAAPDAVARRVAGAGGTVMRTAGSDVPVELLLACGITPVAILPRPGAPCPRADALLGPGNSSRVHRSVLDQGLESCGDFPVLVSHANDSMVQVFATVRELARIGDIPKPRLHLLDLLHQPRASSERYNRARLAQLVEWLTDIGSAPTDASVSAANQLLAEQARLLDEVRRWRSEGRISGADFLAIAGSAAVLPAAEHVAALGALVAGGAPEPAEHGAAVFLTGASPQPVSACARIEAAGACCLGDDLDGGERSLEGAGSAGSLAGLLERLADPVLRTPRALLDPEVRARKVVDRSAALGAGRIIHLCGKEDEASPWDLAVLEPLARSAGLVVERCDETGAPRPAPIAPVPAEKPQAERPPRPAASGRSRKGLASLSGFGEYQRIWFAGVREQVATGSPFAVVAANSPQEMLRALGIPFVVNQWWASIVAAKQQAPRYAALLEAHGYPGDCEAYSAQGLAAVFDDDADLAPWGGLPRPSDVQALFGSEATPGIYLNWAREAGAVPMLFEKTADPRMDLPVDWWNGFHEGWDSLLEAERLDLLESEIRMVIAALEQRNGLTFDPARFRDVMDLVNEQEDHYRDVRDLIARTVPAPVSIVDTMPATMVPQWHRGTEWARDAARAFHEEVAGKALRGEAACPNEKVRLAWIGRGLWSSMAFYQRWEESHGAVFVWSMYLALAADGYIRRIGEGQDPVRALAARFLTMGDELRMPSWAAPWHVKEVMSHGCDGVVALSDADPFVLKALRAAGIPVLALTLDNYDGAAAIEQAANEITRFIEEEAAPRAELRLAGDAG